MVFRKGIVDEATYLHTYPLRWAGAVTQPNKQPFDIGSLQTTCEDARTMREGSTRIFLGVLDFF
jgi:hypothetical protein